MELSEILSNLKKVERGLYDNKQSLSETKSSSKGVKGLNDLIEEARQVKSIGETIKTYGESIKEDLKTFMSKAEEVDEAKKKQ